jgi:6-phosphogluconolactonase (cycloisomerase 2 family)
MLGDGRIVTAEMGHDLLRFWNFSAERGLGPAGTVALPHGSGPRHFARAANGRVYVNTEYSGEVAALVPSTDGWLELLGMFPASASGVQAGDAAAEICLDPSERHLYVGVRGSNRICKLALDGEGLPQPLEEFSCGGDWPRHHCFDGERLVVALERSDALATFTPGVEDGVLQPRQLLATGSPTCLLPAR